MGVFSSYQYIVISKAYMLINSLIKIIYVRGSTLGFPIKWILLKYELSVSNTPLVHAYLTNYCAYSLNKQLSMASCFPKIIIRKISEFIFGSVSIICSIAFPLNFVCLCFLKITILEKDR